MVVCLWMKMIKMDDQKKGSSHGYMRMPTKPSEGAMVKTLGQANILSLRGQKISGLMSHPQLPQHGSKTKHRQHIYRKDVVYMLSLTILVQSNTT